MPAWPAVLLALPCLAVGAATLAAGTVPPAQPQSTLLTKFASFIDWGLAAWVAATLLTVAALLVTRSRAAVAPLLVVSLLGLGIQASWVAPYFTSESRPMVAGQSLRVATLNMELGSADRGQVLELAQNSDVLALVEITPQAIEDLRTAGLEEVMPHRIGDGMEYASGTAIYSRTPIEQVADLGTAMQSTLARVDAGGAEVFIAAVHPVNPNSGGRGWAEDSAKLRDGLAPHLDKNLVVTGDFNSVRGHFTMTNLAGDGLSDTADLAGAGLPRTWPMRGLPFPVIAIDHTLVSPTLTARDFSVRHVANTDHAGLLVTVGVAQG